MNTNTNGLTNTNTNTTAPEVEEDDAASTARMSAWGNLCDAFAHAKIARRALRRADTPTARGVGVLLGKVERELGAVADAVDDALTVPRADRAASYPEIARKARARLDLAHDALLVLFDAAGTDGVSPILSHAARVIGTALENVEAAQADLDAWAVALARPVEGGEGSLLS